MNTNIRFLKQTGLAIASIALFVLPAAALANTLDRQLQLGMSGTDVSALQTFLAQDNTLYPQGLVTGYYGALTQSAVSNFQARNGIPTVGRVGPVTMVALNAQMATGLNGGATATGTVPMISSVSVGAGRNTATVAWNTNESAKGVVYYSASPLTTYEHLNSVDVSGSVAMTDSNMRASQNVSLSGLNANTTYYYMVYVTDMDGLVSVTMPATFQTTI